MPPLPSFGNIGGQVTVVGSWTGSEQDSFMAMVAPFEQMTGVKVQYTGSRDLNAQLTAGIASKNLPDVAGLPGPGAMIQWAKQGALKPLDFLDVNAYKADTPPGFADLGVVEGKTIGIFVKAAVKGLIWFNPKVYTGGAPANWDALEATSPAPAQNLWCVGLESGGASGWPATDWIEDIVLRQAGPDIYDKWVKGQQKWSSPEIKTAFQTFGDVLSKSNGGPNYIVSTNFGDAANPMFKTPPGCLFTHQASFITDFFQKQGGAKAGDYDFFPFPDIKPEFNGVTGGGDLFGMFNDTPQARALIQWLVTPQAQEIWVKRGGAISASKSVPLSDYPDDTSRRSAQILTTAKVFRFDASDQMPNAMNDAFFKAMVQFAQNPGQLDSILSNLDNVQKDAYGT